MYSSLIECLSVLSSVPSTTSFVHASFLSTQEEEAGVLEIQVQVHPWLYNKLKVIPHETLFQNKKHEKLKEFYKHIKLTSRIWK